MEKIIKNVPIKIEFGSYGNFADMIPKEILKHRPDEYFKVLIRWQYPNEERTIDLWDTNDKNIDFESFKEV